MGVEYNFLGYQQPINADGSSIFNGKLIPVKIKLTDYTGASVPNATAHVFFSQVLFAITGSEVEAVSGTATGDLGNLMRYDPTALQYVFNWDNSALQNGTYQVRVGLGEGSCAQPHLVTLSLGKKK